MMFKFNCIEIRQRSEICISLHFIYTRLIQFSHLEMLKCITGMFVTETLKSVDSIYLAYILHTTARPAESNEEFSSMILSVHYMWAFPPRCQVRVDLDICYVWHMHAGNTLLDTLDHLTLPQYLKIKLPVQITLECCLQQKLICGEGLLLTGRPEARD